jgi:hypothetical protein
MGQADGQQADLAPLIAVILVKNCRSILSWAPRRLAMRAWALAGSEGGAPPPAQNRASHLRTVRTDTAKAAATFAAV